MAYEQKDGDFNLFRNPNKEGETYPDYTGTAFIGGKKYRIAGWIKKNDKGSFLVGKITEPKPKEDPGDQPHDDDLPF